MLVFNSIYSFILPNSVFFQYHILNVELYIVLENVVGPIRSHCPSSLYGRIFAVFEPIPLPSLNTHRCTHTDTCWIICRGHGDLEHKDIIKELESSHSSELLLCWKSSLTMDFTIRTRKLLPRRLSDRGRIWGPLLWALALTTSADFTLDLIMVVGFEMIWSNLRLCLQIYILSPFLATVFFYLERVSLQPERLYCTSAKLESRCSVTLSQALIKLCDISWVPSVLRVFLIKTEMVIIPGSRFLWTLNANKSGRAIH